MITKTKKTKIKKNIKFKLNSQYIYIIAGSVVWLILWMIVIVWSRAYQTATLNFSQLLSPNATSYLFDLVTITPLIIGSFVLSWGWNLKLARGYKWLFVWIIIGGILLSILSFIAYDLFHLMLNSNSALSF